MWPCPRSPSRVWTGVPTRGGSASAAPLTRQCVCWLLPSCRPSDPALWTGRFPEGGSQNLSSVLHPPSYWRHWIRVLTDSRREHTASLPPASGCLVAWLACCCMWRCHTTGPALFLSPISTKKCRTRCSVFVLSPSYKTGWGRRTSLVHKIKTSLGGTVRDCL